MAERGRPDRTRRKENGERHRAGHQGGHIVTTVNGSSCHAVKCGSCDRASAVILPDGSIQVQSRHGGANHYTVIPVRMIVNSLPITRSLKTMVLESLK